MSFRFKRQWSGSALMAMSLVCATHAHAAVVRHALIVAFNGSDRPSTAALRFADDDGYRWRETFERLGVDATLLTVPDAETARLEAGRMPATLAPTTSALDAAVEVLAQKVRDDRAAGNSPDVIFVYVGHGQTDSTGRAYLTLVDGQLDQQRLYAGIVDRFGADFVHVIIDACHAGGVVGSRGADAKIIDELRTALSREQLRSRPNVGALFAESEEGETHEWSRLRAGVFSHAARSGLLGGADVNRDGNLSYGELDAFIAASIRGVKSARARLSLKTSAPALDPARLLTGPAPSGPTLQVPSDSRFSRLSVEDDDGVRLADINRHDGERVALSLPQRDSYWLRTPVGEARLSAAQLTPGTYTLAAAEVSQRGGVEEGYTRGLFAVPFGRAFYEGFQASQDLPTLRFEADAPESTASSPRLRFDGAWLNLGLSVGLPVNVALLGAEGLSAGASLAWRSEGPWYLSGRAQWTVATGTLDAATVHRVGLGVLAGWRGSTRIAPFIEAGPQWVPTLVARRAGLQGDLAAFGGHLAVGATGSRDFLRGLRLCVTFDVDAIVVDGRRRALPVPGLELSLTL